MKQFCNVCIPTEFISGGWSQVFALKDRTLGPSSAVITKLNHELLTDLQWCINKANKVFVVKVEERV